MTAPTAKMSPISRHLVDAGTFIKLSIKSLIQLVCKRIANVTIAELFS